MWPQNGGGIFPLIPFLDSLGFLSTFKYSKQTSLTSYYDNIHLQGKSPHRLAVRLLFCKLNLKSMKNASFSEGWSTKIEQRFKKNYSEKARYVYDSQIISCRANIENSLLFNNSSIHEKGIHENQKITPIH